MKGILNRLSVEDETIKDHLTSRSVLYNLQPMGIGTPYIESLSSYLSRLSIVHNVTLSDLLKGTVAPLLKKQYIVQELNSGITKSTARVINDVSIISINYVDALERLTGRGDLANLTMLNWKGIFSKDLCSKYRKWCPVCLNEMKLNDKPVYEPLIWYLKDIQKCDVHSILLQDKCNNCNRRLLYLHSRYIVGTCQHCGSWLKKKKKEYEAGISDEERFIIKNYKQLIESTGNVNFYPSKGFISSFLERVRKQLGFNSNHKFSIFLGYASSTMSDWISSKYVPSPQTLIHIMSKLNTTIYQIIYTSGNRLNVDLLKHNNFEQKRINFEQMREILYKELNTEKPKSLYQIAKESNFYAITARNRFPSICDKITENYNLYKAVHKEKIVKKIEHNLKLSLLDKRPISLAEFSRTHKISKKLIKKYAPNLSQKLSDRYKIYLSQSKKERIKESLNEIEKIANDLYKRGVYPSIGRIMMITGQRSVFLEEEIRRGWKKIMFKLGYKLE